MSLPNEFKNRMKDLLKDEYDEFCDALTGEVISNAIRINTAKPNAKQLIMSEFSELPPVLWCDDGFYADKTKISGNHPYHLAGLFYFQEASAMCAGEAIPIENGDRVLDLCSAPGGKSTHIAAKLNGTGFLVSNEINKKRSLILSENIERMGFENVIVTNESPERLEEKFPYFFDKIVVDAPCSGEGMFKKEPQAITEWSLAHTLSCSERQKNILKSALKMLKPGGMIVYSTCTFAPCENEENIAFLLDNFKNLELLNIPKLSCIEDGLIPMTKRIYPHKQRGEGHFVALLKDTGMPVQSTEKTQKSNVTKENLKLIHEFFEKFMNIPVPDGVLTAFNDQIYVLPHGISIDTIKVVRAGLNLGVCKKGRFEPSHALACSKNNTAFKNTIDFNPKSAELLSYLSGNTLPCDKNGWVCVTVSNIPIGWGKASGGILKNHYPKHLRILG